MEKDTKQIGDCAKCKNHIDCNDYFKLYECTYHIEKEENQMCMFWEEQDDKMPTLR